VRGTLRLGVVLAVLVCCIVCDQAAKIVAKETLATQPPIYLLNGAVTLEYAENSGAFLSLGATLPQVARTMLLVIFAGALTIGALVYALRAHNLSPLQTVALAMIAGGGLGNLIDRVLHNGRVVDFAILSAGPLHTGVFNIADLALVAGLVLFALSSTQSEPERDPST
jgi:signal peptidase II